MTLIEALRNPTTPDLYVKHEKVLPIDPLSDFSPVQLLSDFPDNKFNTGSDGNWQPEQIAPKLQRSSNWEDGLGHGDIEKDRKDRKRLESKRDANYRYHEKIERESMEKQQKEQARQDYHRWVLMVGLHLFKLLISLDLS